MRQRTRDLHRRPWPLPLGLLTLCLLLAIAPTALAKEAIPAEDAPGTVWYVGDIIGMDVGGNAVHVAIYAGNDGPGPTWVNLPDGLEARDFENRAIRFQTAWFDPQSDVEAVDAIRAELLNVVLASAVDMGDDFLVISHGEPPMRLQLTDETVCPYAYGIGKEMFVVYREVEETLYAVGIMIVNG